MGWESGDKVVSIVVGAGFASDDRVNIFGKFGFSFPLRDSNEAYWPERSEWVGRVKCPQATPYDLTPLSSRRAKPCTS